MLYLDEWHDYLRVVVFFISAYGFLTLLRRYHQSSKTWNTKTLDYWYALTMWCVVGLVTSAQGVYLDRPVTPALIIIAAATLVTGKGLHKAGAWGGDS